MHACRIIGGGADGGTAAYQSTTLSRGPLYAIATDPLETSAATVGQDGQLRVWDVASGVVRSTLAPEPGAGRVCMMSARAVEDVNHWLWRVV